ncbi:hypothetical protein K1T71_012350 [Dendrolimus kikuchii]|uniref:Uncharacterized protein n=1 Tax=Dendrolimus kikuchii TaxID=765133 RepID=A0ACC1CLN2_9NEOP|nr:hypothetical protein K1T71_012350 [Dendrolimus kikuchii]
MKFKFCSDGDCPLWALAALHALGSLPTQIFRQLLQCVVEENSDDDILQILKDTSLSSRDECARAAAVVRWVLRQAWSCGCPGPQLAKDLLVLGVPRAHANALAEMADERRENYEEHVKSNGFMINKLTDVAITNGPEETVDTLKLTLNVEDGFTGQQNAKELLIDKNQATALLAELKIAYKKMEEVENEFRQEYNTGTMNIQCPICNDLISEADNIYVTKCGHLFHYICLCQWIERSKSCPQCRHKVTDKCMFRLYPTISSENAGDSAETLLSKLDDANLKLRQQGVKTKETEDKLEKITEELKKNETLIKSYETKLVNRESVIGGLKKQVEYLQVQNNETETLKAENECLNKNIQMLNGLQKVLNATSDEVEQMLRGYTDVRTVATFATALKRALTESESKKIELRNRLQGIKEELGVYRKKYAELVISSTKYRDSLIYVLRKYEALQKSQNPQQKKDNVICIDSDEEINVPNTIDLSKYKFNDSKNNNVDAMVNSIENSDSPYLSLKQSSLALTALQRKQKPDLDKIKPSERMIIPNSIFKKKEPLQVATSETLKMSQPGTSYDGLGGHSKLDTFPERTETPLNSRIPKVTGKHKLKRPNTSRSQDIGEMIKKNKK